MIALWFACAGGAHLSKQGVLFAIEVSDALHLEWDDHRRVQEIVDDLGDEQLGVFWPRPVDTRIQVLRGAFVFGPVPMVMQSRVGDTEYATHRTYEDATQWAHITAMVTKRVGCLEAVEASQVALRLSH